MYDFLKFIDSPDVREYNKNTYFTPTEWAVIIGLSEKRTINEKLDALQYLIGHYSEKDFQEESRNIEPRVPGCEQILPDRHIAMETIRIWKDMLEDRYHSSNVIYGAKFMEKGMYAESCLKDYRFFSTYEKAYGYLMEMQQQFTFTGESYGEIHRLWVEGGKGTDSDRYIFDGDLQLIELLPHNSRICRKDESHIVLLNEPEYPVYIPLPFKKGDIVKVEELRQQPFYGVVPYDWKKPAADRPVHMWMSLECYYNGIEKDFDYTDGGDHDLLRFSYCSDEELPEDEQVLKLIRAVRKGEMDFMCLMQKFSTGELEKLLKEEICGIKNQGDKICHR